MKKLVMIGGTLVLFLTLTLSARGSSITINDRWDPVTGPEKNLYQIVNQMVGTSFQHSAELIADPQEVVATLPSLVATSGHYEIWDYAKYAAITPQVGGFYKAGSTDDGDKTQLLSVYVNGINQPNPGGIPVITLPLIFNPAFAFGFYDRPGTEGYTFYTESFLENGNEQGLLIINFPGRPHEFIIAFEDRSLGEADQDYNDLVLHLKNVPIPETLWLLSGGFLTLTLLGRRRLPAPISVTRRHYLPLLRRRPD
jgi:hypothetical protein